VLRTGRSEYYPEVDASFLASAAASEEELFVLETLGTRSVIIVPMIARGRAIGALTFIAAESGRRFDSSDLWLAERLASRAAIAIDNARLYDEARKARGVVTAT
jgi:GAF domain-containing protein